ncbi:fatty acid metabolism regulator protein [mine drainage metagenome]|uniref:Fatty acid metabolism regulator protein n=1 Tax=mine drainage metagenome TaxID=410659 RepID=A0A1J5TDG2_9ZZZZ
MRSKNRPVGQKTSSFIEEARRRQIIEAAIEVIARSGYPGASLAKVAAHAKISKSIISYHFSGKDELLEETVHQIYEDIWASIGPRFRAERTAAGQLRAFIEAEFAYLEKNRARLLTVGHILMNHRDRRGRLALHEESERQTLQMLGGILLQGQKAGEFRDFAVLPMATTLVHSINGALGHWAANPELSLTDYARELVTIFDLATRKQPAPRTRRG